ncbi:uncharacterized protein CLUP02_00195 [Colletotrichum lupini]|uniref:Uncharacterized protein n=1 Tax=Colletotrichum lupini TaxID=145971 RepID=A0A9Q8W8R3_9PEZI|nr:uncharacterized protein CLUP02_00195 [Colletotrichum lupini]UQC73550.1 hypothetical protein CLUP02_00195 [Colletotrichum lupini]
MGNRGKLNSSQMARLQHLKRVADSVNHCQTCVPPESVGSKTWNGHADMVDSLEFAFSFLFCQNSRLQTPSNECLESATYMDDVYGLGDGYMAGGVPVLRTGNRWYLGIYQLHTTPPGPQTFTFTTSTRSLRRKSSPIF